jgi:hypothetical protein
MSPRSSQARVTLRPRRLWSLRASLGLARGLLYVVALVGVVATARSLIAPPLERPIVVSAARSTDLGAEWLALTFSRAYLTWSPDPLVHQSALRPFLAPGGDPDAGLTTAAGASEQVQWVAIADERDGPGGESDYTVAAGVGGGTVRYLAVAVAQELGGADVLARYPALVGAPRPAPAGGLDGPTLATVSSPALVAVLQRAMRNYVDDSAENLAADLAPAADVAPVATGLTLRSVVRLAVERSGVVLATVLATDSDGDLFTLAYEVTLAQVGGRWEITRIQS